MKQSADLWKKYCSFFEKDFSEQLEYNEKKKEEYFKKWKNTKMTKQLCPKGVEKFEDVPLTTYGDYPILHEFGREIEKLERTVPRRKGELLWDYYDRISKQVAPMLDGWMGDEYAFCARTSGTTGESKWFAHGKGAFENLVIESVTLAVLLGSDDWGKTITKAGDKWLNIMAPAPYITGYLLKAALTKFNCIPPPHITDNIADMRRKISIAFKTIEKGEKIDFAGGVASSFYMACRYFTQPEKLYKEYYQSMNFGLMKFILFLMWAKHKLAGRKYERTCDIMPVKGIAIGGVDTKLYLDIIKKEFGREPVNLYGSTELGFVMIGPPDRKINLMPDLRVCYFEFLTQEGTVEKIDKLKKECIYELVGTPFGSMPIRYRMGDLFRVVDFRDDGLPIFSFAGRLSNLIDIYGYFRLSEEVVVRALSEAGLPPTDKWAITKIIDPKEHLLLLMEKEWEHSEEKASKLVFESLRKVSPDFQSYVTDFKIKGPSEVIKVEYLKKGAFMRYALKKMKEGVHLGQIKTPKIVTPDRLDIIATLKGV
ncbi:MAG: GH3 auxin-responsive promoter family protein [Candidatus Thermoplasmatota archaeon]|nr:GH3 auxin-responsive promoter family protein [Candidatus Thermoplasmatota archaeon]MBU4256772.1 GH3 auxin-responsive promoter family protein [Candidatus Thermoplasmatota archaeon]MCG2826717.1 GH3 auxin-responsive promoter family protein [Thermoplasmatales archaeon]